MQILASLGAVAQLPMMIGFQVGTRAGVVAEMNCRLKWQAWELGHTSQSRGHCPFVCN